MSCSGKLWMGDQGDEKKRKGEKRWGKLTVKSQKKKREGKNQFTSREGGTHPGPVGCERKKGTEMKSEGESDLQEVKGV